MFMIPRRKEIVIKMKKWLSKKMREEINKANSK